MIEKATSPANIQSMLNTLRSLQTQAGGAALPAEAGGSIERPGFGELVRGMVNEVNAAQQHSRAQQTAFERGQAPLTDVVVAMQKSSLAFEATLQVRNKVLKAYEDILNMPV